MSLRSNNCKDEYERGYQRGFDDGYVRGRIAALEDQRGQGPPAPLPTKKPFSEQASWVTVTEADHRLISLGAQVGQRVRVLRDFNNNIIGVIGYAGEANDGAE